MAIDTIFARSSGRPPAAVALIRISGPRAFAAGEALAGTLPEPRRAALRRLRAADGEILDDALLLAFPGPQSATGEDVVELHCHGGRAVVDAVLTALAQVDGLREAAPGEFTRRSFENGRIDLTEAEGLADLLEAETESQRRAALLVAEGGLRRQIEEWQGRLLDLSARAEAAIDYVGEEDVSDDGSLRRDCAALASCLDNWLARPRIEPLKDGIRIVVAGPVNAGKSSLVNALCESDRAIVTDIPGTTRDQIDVPLSIGGVPFIVTDTAGLRESDDPVENIGVERARRAAAAADILLWLGGPEDAPHRANVILVQPKSDLIAPDQRDSSGLAVSALSGEGLSTLISRIQALGGALLPEEGAIALNRRQAGSLEQLKDAVSSAASADDIVLTAHHLQVARVAVDSITGRSGVENLLDTLFGRFCLGK